MVVVVLGQCGDVVGEQQFRSVEGVGDLVRACRDVVLLVVMDVVFDVL